MRAPLLCAGAVALACLPVAASNPTTGPTANYWVSVDTASGLMGMQGKSGLAMMGAVMGGGMSTSVARTLVLDFGSRQAPAGAPPQAGHDIPAGLKLGRTLPLETPRREPAAASAGGAYERPKGRIAIYWGCGERARPGQPVIFDAEKIWAGQMPPDINWVAPRSAQGPSLSNSRTYANWPWALTGRNAQMQRTAPEGASLLGEHVVRSNYAPEIRFTLAGSAQDFMGPLAVTMGPRTATGAQPVSWRSIGNATAYGAGFIGMGQDQNSGVIWSSSDVPAVMLAAMDWVPPAEAARLVQLKAFLPPTAVSCTIPAEVMKAAPMGTLFLGASGPEADFAFPPRPADPRAVWNIEWTAKVRFRSSYMTMVGMGSGIGPGAAAPGGEGEDDAKPGCPPASSGASVGEAIGGALGGTLGGALGRRLGGKPPPQGDPACQ